jgi:hypothetical protein
VGETVALNASAGFVPVRVNVTVEPGGYPGLANAGSRLIVIVFAVSVLNAVPGLGVIVFAALALEVTSRPATTAAAVATTPAAMRRRTTRFMGLPVRCDGGRSGAALSAVVLIT